MSSSSGRRKFTVRHTVVVDVGCNCRRTRKLSSFFSSFSTSKPKPSPLRPPLTPARNQNQNPLSSYYPFSPATTFTTTRTTSPWDWETSHHPSSSSAASPYEEDASSNLKKNRSKKKKKKEGKAGRVGESVVVVKDSSDPYVDFRESILQMIVEKEIYDWGELKELLHYLLALNSFLSKSLDSLWVPSNQIACKLRLLAQLIFPSTISFQEIKIEKKGCCRILE